MDLTNAHPLRCFKSEWSFKLIHMVAEEVADGFFIQTRVFCNAGESATKTLMTNPRHQSLSHLAFGVDHRQQFCGGFAASLTPPAARGDINGHAFAGDDRSRMT